MPKPEHLFAHILKFLLCCAFLSFQTDWCYGQCSNSFRYMLKGNNQEFAFDVLELPGGDKIIGGQTKSFGAGGWDFYLTRMTKSGAIVWNKTYGGAGDEVMRRLRLSDDGNILITGSTTSY